MREHRSVYASASLNPGPSALEYPAATERQAPPSDTPNLTAFFGELRSGLGSAIISLATPAGYWFLKGFEMDKIAPKLDMINMMSYDYRTPLPRSRTVQNWLTICDTQMGRGTRTSSVATRRPSRRARSRT